MAIRAVNPPAGDRRVALAERRRVAEMSPEEMQRELLTSEVTDCRTVALLMKQGHHLPSPCPT